MEWLQFVSIRDQKRKYLQFKMSPRNMQHIVVKNYSQKHFKIIHANLLKN